MLGIFISNRRHVGNGVGGVQTCSNEYIEVIQTAGVALDIQLFDSDSRLLTRAAKRFFTSPYFRPIDPRDLDRIALHCAAANPDFLFLNQVSLASIAPRLKAHTEAKVVLLSHGLESTDLLHLIKSAPTLPLSGHARPAPSIALGRTILVEASLRQHVDAVCALSPFDAQLEEWVGARSATWLPRIIRDARLKWSPCGRRVGFLGTLDHAPNLHGLVSALEQLEHLRQQICIRVIGGPDHIGRWLSKQYSSVEYLGQLPENQAREEAATWHAFIHLIFVAARGCSTKLATAISWHLPIITTTQGRRGYEWERGRLITADTPSDFATECIRILDLETAGEARDAVIEIAQSSPTLSSNAERFRRFLAEVRRGNGDDAEQ